MKKSQKERQNVVSVVTGEYNNTIIRSPEEIPSVKSYEDDIIAFLSKISSYSSKRCIYFMTMRNYVLEYGTSVDTN
jgi:hypothetical protein